VTRFCRAIGLDSYQHLLIELAQERGRGEVSAWGSTEIDTDISPEDSLERVVQVVGSADLRAIQQTIDRIDLDALERAAQALAKARRIDVYGVGASGLVAQDLVQKLLRIGLIAHAHSDPHLAVTNAVQLKAGDVAIAITHSGATGDVIEPLRVAFERGATTVAITGRPDSSVTQYADHVLTTSTARESELRPAAMSSRTSQLLVVDCLFVGVAQRTYETAAPALSSSYEALAHRHRGRT